MKAFAKLVLAGDPSPIESGPGGRPNKQSLSKRTGSVSVLSLHNS